MPLSARTTPPLAALAIAVAVLGWPTGRASACDLTMIDRVESVRFEETSPRNYRITARGETNSGGWTNVVLRHVATRMRPDGVEVVLDFVGCRPGGMATMALVTHEASFHGSTRMRERDLVRVVVRATGGNASAPPDTVRPAPAGPDGIQPRHPEDPHPENPPRTRSRPANPHLAPPGGG